MTQLYWAPQAGEDLAAVFAYITQDSEQYAWLTVREIVAATGRLREFPELGRVVPELNRPDVRELIWRSYRIVYQYRSAQDEAWILTVFRGERQFEVPESIR